MSLTAAWCALRPPPDARHIGGSWYISTQQYFFNPDALKTASLYQKTGDRYRLVSDGIRVGDWAFFEPDCVIFRAAFSLRWEHGLKHPEDYPAEVSNVILAVCAGRTPAAIALESGNFLVDPSGFWNFGRLLPIDSIRGLAMRQAPFHSDWRSSVVLKEEPFSILEQ